MADEIARKHRVLYIDCELSDKQFQLRYTSDAGTFMQKLKMLKIKHDWNLLIIAHTPKRALCSPITRNDLAGSSRLFNFFDSVFAIGQSAKDEGLKYIKQVKVRHGVFEYGSDHVITCEIVKDSCFAHFRQLGCCPEREHLKERSEKDIDTRDLNIKDIYEKGMSYREIADELSLSKSLIGKVVGRLKEKSLIEPVHVHGGVDDSESVDTPETQQRLPFKDD